MLAMEYKMKCSNKATGIPIPTIYFKWNYMVITIMMQIVHTYARAQACMHGRHPHDHKKVAQSKVELWEIWKKYFRV